MVGVVSGDLWFGGFGFLLVRYNHNTQEYWLLRDKGKFSSSLAHKPRNAMTSIGKKNIIHYVVKTITLEQNTWCVRIE